MVPEVEIDYETLSAEINGRIDLNCMVKSLTEVEVTWSFEGEVVAEKITE